MATTIFDQHRRRTATNSASNNGNQQQLDEDLAVILVVDNSTDSHHQSSTVVDVVEECGDENEVLTRTNERINHLQYHPQQSQSQSSPSSSSLLVTTPSTTGTTTTTRNSSQPSRPKQVQPRQPRQQQRLPRIEETMNSNTGSSNNTSSNTDTDTANANTSTSTTGSSHRLSQLLDNRYSNNNSDEIDTNNSSHMTATTTAAGTSSSTGNGSNNQSSFMELSLTFRNFWRNQNNHDYHPHGNNTTSRNNNIDNTNTTVTNANSDSSTTTTDNSSSLQSTTTAPTTMSTTRRRNIIRRRLLNSPSKHGNNSTRNNDNNANNTAIRRRMTHHNDDDDEEEHFDEGDGTLPVVRTIMEEEDNLHSLRGDDDYDDDEQFDDHTNNYGDDTVLDNCYFWAFLFRNTTDSRTTTRTSRGRRRNTNTTVCGTSCTVWSWLLVSCTVMIWIFGFYSFLQLQSTTTNTGTVVSTEFDTSHSTLHSSSTASTTGRSPYIHNNSNNKNNHTMQEPIIYLVLSSRGNSTLIATKNVLQESDARNVGSMATTTTQQQRMMATLTTTSRTTTTNNHMSSCQSNEKPTHRGTAQYTNGRDYTKGLQQFLTNHRDGDNDTIIPTVHISSYYSYMDDGLEWWARDNMASPDGTSVFVQIQYTPVDHPQQESRYTLGSPGNRPHQQRSNTQMQHESRRNLMNAIDDYTNQFYSEYDNNNSAIPLCITVNPTGIPYLEVELGKSVHSLCWNVLLHAVPITTVLISLMLWYSYNANLWYIWIIPFLAMGTSLSMLSIMVYFLIIPYFSAHVSVFLPLFMILLSMATSCVQIISLLSRYLEEKMDDGEVMMPHLSTVPNQSGRSSCRAVRRMLKSSGSTLISTSLVWISILLIFLISTSSILFQSILISVIAAIIASSCVNMTMTSTILKYTRLGELVVIQRQDLSTMADGSNIVDYENGDNLDTRNENTESRHSSHGSNDLILAESFTAQMLPTPRQSIWFFISRNIVKVSRAIVLTLILLQIIVPVAIQVKHIKLSYQPLDVLSTNSKHVDTYTELGNQIGLGRLHPYHIVFDGYSSNMSMTSKSGFEAMHFVINEMQSRHVLSELNTNVSHDFDATRLRYDVFNGITVIQNTVVSYDMFLAARYCGLPTRKKSYCPLELLRMISAFNEQATSSDTFSTFTLVQLGNDPFSIEGIEWLVNARIKLDRLRKSDKLAGMTVDLVGGGGLVYDTVVSVYELYRLLIYSSIAVVVFLVVIFYRSLIIPIRSVVTIGLTVSFSMGLAVLLYQDGILNWAKIMSLYGKKEGICWLVPALAFPLIVGISLTFESLLTTRILEFRLKGYEHKSSLALGLDSVGGCNACAGMIMAIIFGAPLLFGDNEMLHQLSFVLTSAVLIDTLVIRTMVVPIMIGSFSFSWWPRRLPQEKFCLEEFNLRNPLSVDRSSHDDAGTYWETLITSSGYEPLSRNR